MCVCVFVVARKPDLLVVYVSLCVHRGCMSLGYEVGEDPTHVGEPKHSLV